MTTFTVVIFFVSLVATSKSVSHDVNAFTSWGAEPKRRQWRMKRGGSVVSKRVLQAAAKQDEYYEPDRASEAQRDRWFESNCHHHSAALENQGLQFFYPLGITAEGFAFFRVHFGDVNGSSRHFVHTVVWLSCRKIGVARLVESV